MLIQNLFLRWFCVHNVSLLNYSVSQYPLCLGIVFICKYTLFHGNSVALNDSLKC
jgi:hypothetical protein